MPAQFGEAAAQFRLENHHQRDRDEDGEASNDEADHDQVQQLRDEREREEDNRQAGQHFRSARPAEIEVAVINPDAQEHDLERAPPVIEKHLRELVNHRRRRRAVLRWCEAHRRFRPRRELAKSAPRARAGAKSSRRSRSPCSTGAAVILPRKDLRETPTTSGRSSIRSRSRLASSCQVVRGVLPKPIPGSKARHIGSIPERTAQLKLLSKKISHFRHDILVGRI